MGIEDNRRIYLVKKKFGDSWKLVCINGSPLTIRGTQKALSILKRLEEKENG